MHIVMIIPTYNEKDNSGLLIDRLQEEFQRIPHEMSILVADDNSPDGTASVVKERMGACRNVFLITGNKEGLGSAYIRGMKHAMEAMNVEAVMEMDADFSHKPEDVPRLLSALSDGVDFVIGSRYVEGGKIPEDWGLMRRLNSRFGNIFARYISGMYRVRDCTAGFRAIRVSLLEKIDLAGLHVQGYAFQIALLNQALIRKAVIREIPSSSSIGQEARPNSVYPTSWSSWSTPGGSGSRTARLLLNFVLWVSVGCSPIFLFFRY